MKRNIQDENQIVSSNLYNYLDVESRFNEYELPSLSKPLVSYYPNLVQEFFANYLALLENDYPKGNRLADMRNRPQVIVRGMIIDILDCIINQMLFSQDYEAPSITHDLEHHILIVSS